MSIKDFKFVSKLPALPKSDVNISSWIEDEIQFSLKRLGIQSLYGFLIHRSEDLLGNSGKKIVNALNKLKSKGIVKKIGISIYEPSELEKLTGLIELDIVQAPLNIIDQRLLSSGWLSKLYKNNIEVHTRSAFLQGLFFNDKLPNKLISLQPYVDILYKLSSKYSLPVSELALNYCLCQPNINKVLIGVDTESQLIENIIMFVY